MLLDVKIDVARKGVKNLKKEISEHEYKIEKHTYSSTASKTRKQINCAWHKENIQAKKEQIKKYNADIKKWITAIRSASKKTR